MDDDLFFDLFGDEGGLLTPKSSPGSTDQDSGLGSPFDSNSDDASPLQWDTIPRDGEFWDSILDDLPSDVTDDVDGSNPEQGTYQHHVSPTNNVFCYDISPINANSNDPAWSANVLQEGFSFNNFNSSVNFNASLADSDKWKYASDSFQDGGSLLTALDNMTQPTATANHLTMQGHLPDNNILPSPTSVTTNDLMMQVAPLVASEDKSPSPLVNSDDIEMEMDVPPTPEIQETPLAQSTVTFNIGDAAIVLQGTGLKSNQIDQNLLNLLTKITADNSSLSKSSSSPSSSSSVESIKIDDDDDEEDDLDSPSPSECKDCAPLSPIEQKQDKSLSYNDHDYAERDFSHLIKSRGISNGIGPGLTLTAEEKKLLAQEKLQLPENVPLTKEEEKVLKKVRRKIKNKQSAMESRKRRKEYISNLEHRVKHCTDVNNELKKKVEKLSEENKTLVGELKVMKDFISKSFKQARVANMGTCLAVLVLSFALFVLPFNPLQFFDSRSVESPQDQLTAATTVSTYRSRTLLTVDDHTDYFYQDELSNNSLMYNFDHHLLEDGTDEASKFNSNLGTTLVINVDNVLKKNFLFIAQQNLTGGQSELQSNNYTTQTTQSHYITS